MERGEGQSREGYASWLLAVSFLVFLLGFWVIRYSLVALGHDQVALLLEADRFLAGNEIYGPHLSETNPPLIIWFSAIPDILAHHLPFSAVTCFRVLILSMLCCRTAWCASLLRRSGKMANGLALAIFSFAIIAVALRINPMTLASVNSFS